MLNNTAKVGQKWFAMTVGRKMPLKELLIGRVKVPSAKTRHEELLVDVLHANTRWETVDQTIDGMLSSLLEDLIGGCIVDDVIAVQLDLLPVGLQGWLAPSMFGTDVVRTVTIVAEGATIKGIPGVSHRLLFVVVSTTTGIRGVVSTAAATTTISTTTGARITTARLARRGALFALLKAAPRFCDGRGSIETGKSWKKTPLALGAASSSLAGDFGMRRLSLRTDVSARRIPAMVGVSTSSSCGS
jgi:hypothetical protein